MKNPLPSILIILLLLSACGKQGNEEQTSAADSLASDSSHAISASQVSSEPAPYDGPPAKYLAGGTYTKIPLTEGWKDPHYVLIVNPGNQQVPVYAAPGHPDRIKPASYITQLTQTRWYSEKIFNDTHPCTRILTDDAFRFYEIATGPGNERGWVLSYDIMQPEDLNLGTYSLDGRNLTLASMKTHDKMFLGASTGQENACATAKTLFLYDDKFLYLIDAPPNEDLVWMFDSYLSLMDHPPMGSVSGKAEGDSYVYTWGVPNGRVRFGVRYEKDYIKSTLYEMTGVEGDFEEGMEEEGEGEEERAEIAYDYTDEVFTKEGVFEDVSAGDCGHIEFSCGDFGNATSENLSEEDKKLWYELLVSDGESEGGNKKYVGKTFVIKFKMVPGDRCDDPSLPQYGPIESLISFKLKK